MLARVLSIAGAALPANLMGAGTGNDAGHWESRRLMRYQNSLLKRMDSNWHDWRALEKSKLSIAQQNEAKEEIRNILDDEFNEAPLYLVKDPRICRFTPLFLAALEEVGQAVHVVIPVRNPLEVCESLVSRTEAWPSELTKGDAALLWLRHVLDAEAATRGRKRVLFIHSDFMADWRTAIDNLTEQFEINWPYPIDDIAPDIDGFIKPGLRHHEYSTEDVLLDPVLREWVGEAWQAILVLSRNPGSKAAMGKLDDVRKSFNSAAPILQQRNAEVRLKSQQEVAEVQGALKAEQDRTEKLTADLEEKTKTIAQKETTAADLAKQLSDRKKLIAERDGKIGTQKGVMTKQSGRIEQLESQRAALAATVESKTAMFKAQIGQKDAELAQLSETLKKKNQNGAEQDAALTAIRASTSWRITAPLRRAVGLMRSRNDGRLERTQGRSLASLKTYLNYRLKHKRRDARQLIRIMQSGEFDPNWYLDNNADVAEARLDPLLHYLEHGHQEGRPPSATFDAKYYVSANIDVADDEVDPFVHYALFGKAEGRRGQRPRVNKNPSYFHVASEYVPTIDHEKQRDKLKKYIAYKKTRAAKTVVFTANVGDYDDLYVPEFLDMETDYVCFTDTPKDTHGVWELRPLPWIDNDPTRSARFVKLNPHYVLPEYEYSVWIDGNILLRCSTEDIISAVKNEAYFATFQHPLRNCVYDEVKACIKADKDDSVLVAEQGERYRQKDIPNGRGLYETNVLARRHNDPQCIDFMNAWWTELNRFSKRDQISLIYVIQEIGTAPALIVPAGKSSRNHPNFALFRHTRRKGYVQPQFLKEFSTFIDPWKLAPFTKSEFVKTANKTTVDIVVCVHNALDDVTNCLSSVAKHINPDKHRIIIVDDGSETPTQTFLEEFAAGSPGATLIRNDVAQRYTKAANIGIKASTANWVIMLNSDTIVTDAWAEKLVATGLMSPHNGLVGPLSNAASYQSFPSIKGENGQTAVNEIPPGKTIDDLGNFCEQVSYNNYAPNVPLLHGCCLAISRKVIEKIGLMDEVSFPNGFGEENDYCFRATDEGFKLVVATSAYIFHAKTKSYTPETRVKLQQKSGSAFSDKHGRPRVRRAVQTFESNTLLAKIREQSEQYYADGTISKNTTQAQPSAKSVNINSGASLNTVLLCSQSRIGPRSSTYIRMKSPLTSASLSGDVALRINKNGVFEVDAGADICIVQRTAIGNMDRAEQLLSELSKTNTRLIIDNDDALVLLDSSHPEAEKYAAENNVLEHLMKAADRVFLSTPPLLDIYGGLNKSAHVIPNSLDKRIWDRHAHPEHLIGERNLIKMVFMGTKTHDEDFKLILPALDQLAEAYPNTFDVTLVGGLFNQAPERSWLKTIALVEGKTLYPNFADWVLKQGPFDIGLSPLVDTPFNRHKSDIKFLDYCAMKVLPILSDLTPYQNDPMVKELAILVENTTENWFAALEQACKDLKAYRPMVEAGYEHLWTNRNSEQTGDTLLGLLQSN